MKQKVEADLKRKKALALGIIVAAWLFVLFQLFGANSSDGTAKHNIQQEVATTTSTKPPGKVSSPIALPNSFEHSSDAGDISICPVASSTFKPLTSFTFWGKTMNTSSPCPTAGLNNQLTMVLGLLHCSLQQQQSSNDVSSLEFRFKDITCSPTGGKDSAVGKPRRQFRVGSDDYEYQWFRWSELFHIRNPITPKGRALCLADAHTWSEHPWMKKCPTFVDHIYGTPAFWEMRKALALHSWFQTLSRELIHHYGGTGNNNAAALNDTAAVEVELPAQPPGRNPPFLALHVRRGDYENFCRQTAKSSGVKKFRTAPFIWSMRATDAQLTDVVGLRPDQRPKQLSSSFMASCFPTTQKIIAHVGTLCTKNPLIRFLYLATNSRSFLEELSSGLAASEVPCARRLPVVTLQKYLDEQHALGDLKAKYHGYWGRRQWSQDVAEGQGIKTEDADDITSTTISAAVITETERSLLDVNILSFSSSMVLNKYSTFSQSAIDFRMVREGTLNGTMIYWW